MSGLKGLKHETTAEQWATLIKERMDSGMTIKEWCQEKNIKTAGPIWETAGFITKVMEALAYA